MSINADVRRISSEFMQILAINPEHVTTPAPAPSAEARRRRWVGAPRPPPSPDARHNRILLLPPAQTPPRSIPSPPAVVAAASGGHYHCRSSLRVCIVVASRGVATGAAASGGHYHCRSCFPECASWHPPTASPPAGLRLQRASAASDCHHLFRRLPPLPSALAAVHSDCRHSFRHPPQPIVATSATANASGHPPPSPSGQLSFECSSIVLFVYSGLRADMMFDL
ncbi:uncharacterized protein LOC122023080 [Zingiber officinale]|uniref:uncharacterized protein LOC122023080 n=1 Tax=Zingiber officinale TaxID=94328 RepID=UPI001C4C259C|nr:uncharacterized protein LOC122023080 [Zingiber officinale]